MPVTTGWRCRAPGSPGGDLIENIALDPDGAGERGEDLLGDLRDLRDEQSDDDVDDLMDDTADLIDDFSDWVDDGELDPEIGAAAITL